MIDYDSAGALGLATLVQHALADDDMEGRAEAVVALAEHESWQPDADDRTWALLLSLAPSWSPGLWADLLAKTAEHRDVSARLGALEDDPAELDRYLDDSVPVWDRAGLRDEQLEELRVERQHVTDERMTVARWMVTMSGDVAWSAGQPVVAPGEGGTAARSQALPADLTEAHTVESAYTGAYATMPQGHLLLGDGRRSLAVLDFGGTVHVGGIRVTDPAVLRTAGEHLLMLAGRLEDRQAPTAPQFVDGFNPAAPVERTSGLGDGL